MYLSETAVVATIAVIIALSYTTAMCIGMLVEKRYEKPQPCILEVREITTELSTGFGPRYFMFHWSKGFKNFPEGAHMAKMHESVPKLGDEHPYGKGYIATRIDVRTFDNLGYIEVCYTKSFGAGFHG